MLAALGRDLVARPLRPPALALDRDRTHVPLSDERPQDGVDRPDLDREPDGERLLVEDPRDPVAVQALLREQPEDEQTGQHRVFANILNVEY
jgi:hypothetical protein